MRKTLLLALVLAALLGLSFGWRSGGAELVARARAWVLGEGEVDGRTFWCPMDPEIVRRGTGSCPICSMELVPFEGGGGRDPGVLSLTDRQVQQAGVRLDSVAARELVRAIDTTGRLEINPARRSTLRMGYPGRSEVERAHVFAAGEQVGETTVVLEVSNDRMVELLAAYRETLTDFARQKREKRELEAERTLERMRALKDEIVGYGLPMANLGRFASTPRFLFSDPLFPVISVEPGTVLEAPELYPGAVLSQGDLLLELADLSELWVWIDLYGEERSLVAPDQRIALEAPAVPGRVFESSVRLVEPFVEARTQTTRARGRVANPKGELAPGMFVRARLEVPLGELLAVPESAVLSSGLRDVVLVAEGGGRFRPRRVVLGRRNLVAHVEAEAAPAFGAEAARYHEVLEGLAPGERVVTAGAFLLKAEAQFQGALAKLDDAADRAAAAVPLSPAEDRAFENVLAAYLEVGGHLVRDEEQGLAEAAEALAASASGVDGGELDAALTKLAAEARGMATEARDGADLDALRVRFGSLSRVVVGVLREHQPARVDAGQLFLFRCPMADDFGYDLWVQDEAGLANPYMGTAMPECGVPAELE